MVYLILSMATTSNLNTSLEQFIQIHACSVSRPWVRLMLREDTAEIVWCYFVGFHWMSLALLWFQALFENYFSFLDSQQK